MLYIDLRPGQPCHSKVMHWKEVTHSDGSYGKKSRRRAWLTIWDKLKSQCTVIDWCTGREWPVNCMKVISARWQLNMPFQRLSGRLNYYITRWRQEVREFGDQLVRRCWNENMPPVEQPRRTKTTHGDVRRGWGGQYVAVFVQSKTPSHTHNPFK